MPSECLHCCGFGVFHVVLCIVAFVAGGRVGRVAGITARALGRAPVHRRAPCAAQPDARRPRGVAVRSSPPPRVVPLSAVPLSAVPLSRTPPASSPFGGLRTTRLLFVRVSLSARAPPRAASTLAAKAVEARSGRTYGVPDVHEKWIVRRTGFVSPCGLPQALADHTVVLERSNAACCCPRVLAGSHLACCWSARSKPQSRIAAHESCGAVRTDVDGWLAACRMCMHMLATREHSRRCLGYYYLSACAAAEQRRRA